MVVYKLEFVLVGQRIIQANSGRSSDVPNQWDHLWQYFRLVDFYLVNQFTKTKNTQINLSYDHMHKMWSVSSILLLELSLIQSGTFIKLVTKPLDTNQIFVGIEHGTSHFGACILNWIDLIKKA